MHGLLEKAQGCLTFPDIPSPDFKTILSNGHTERPIVNGHVNGPKSDDVEATHLPQLLLFSSSDESGIKRLARKHSEWFDSQGDSITERTITNYSHTLTRRGSTLPWRSYCVITSLGQLTNIKSAISTPKKIVGPNKNLGLVFTGQGAQWLGMGKELFANPTFKRSVEKSQEYVKSHLGSDLDIKSMLKGQVGKLSIHEARFSQILTTCLQIALVDLFVDLGVEPSVVVGHSSGEIAAA
jgi:acyl transferase domain-containing protein